MAFFDFSTLFHISPKDDPLRFFFYKTVIMNVNLKHDKYT